MHHPVGAHFHPRAAHPPGAAGRHHSATATLRHSNRGLAPCRPHRKRLGAFRGCRFYSSCWVRIRVRVLQLRTTLTHHQRIHRLLLRVAMEFQPKAFHKQRLQHLRNLILRRPCRKLRLNIKPLRTHPVRTLQLVPLEPVRHRNQLSQPQISDIHTGSIHLHPDIHLARHHLLRCHRLRRLD